MPDKNKSQNGYCVTMVPLNNMKKVHVWHTNVYKSINIISKTSKVAKKVCHWTCCNGRRGTKLIRNKKVYKLLHKCFDLVVKEAHVEHQTCCACVLNCKLVYFNVLTLKTLPHAKSHVSDFVSESKFHHS